MSKWLWLASFCLLEALGLEELYELYCMLVMRFDAPESAGSETAAGA